LTKQSSRRLYKELEDVDIMHRSLIYVFAITFTADLIAFQVLPRKIAQTVVSTRRPKSRPYRPRF
jgi:hypothetical protein